MQSVCLVPARLFCYFGFNNYNSCSSTANTEVTPYFLPSVSVSVWQVEALPIFIFKRGMGGADIDFSITADIFFLIFAFVQALGLTLEGVGGVRQKVF